MESKGLKNAKLTSKMDGMKSHLKDIHSIWSHRGSKMFLRTRGQKTNFFDRINKRESKEEEEIKFWYVYSCN